MAHRFITVLFVFVVFKQPAPAPGCENCKCCVDEACAPKSVQGYTVNDYCTYGCIDGIGGNKCYRKCPNDCVTCEQTITNNCTTCEAGKYVHIYDHENKRCENCQTRCKTCTSSSNCQECVAPYYNGGSTGSCSDTCPTYCKSCTSATQCQECNVPYYNDGDVTDCSLSCLGNCLCITPGECSSCQDGYYNIQSQCQDSCPDKCKTCHHLNNCHSCKDGYYNGKEYDHANSDEVTDCSLPCRETCTRCDSYNQCIHCKDGKYGAYCQNTCSVGCQNGVCAVDEGSCQCKDGFAVPTCTECVQGRYRELCDEICPYTCNDNECKIDTGHCFECNSVNITGDTCDQCVTGTWGNTCTSVCPSGCLDGVCIRETGICESCVGNFGGNRCDKCIDGYHGSECDMECPRNCLEPHCLRDTGFCQSCKGGYLGQTCRECSDGRYGENCELLCISTRCQNNICNRFDGKCLSCPSGLYGSLCELNCSRACKHGSCDFNSGSCFECSDSYSGDKCCIQNGYCRNCSSHTACETCSGGYYGERCDKECPAMCSVGREAKGCERTTGICRICGDGFYGDYCTLACNDQCLNNRCIKDDGHCSEGCADGYEGLKCHASTNNLSTIGTAVGISSAVTMVIVTILVVVLCFIQRRWFRKEHEILRQHLEPTIQTSYVNTEFQPTPAETVQSDNVEDLSDIQQYEELNERNLPKNTDYDQIPLSIT